MFDLKIIEGRPTDDGSKKVEEKRERISRDGRIEWQRLARTLSRREVARNNAHCGPSAWAVSRALVSAVDPGGSLARGFRGRDMVAGGHCFDSTAAKLEAAKQRPGRVDDRQRQCASDENWKMPKSAVAVATLVPERNLEEARHRARSLAH